MTTAIDNGQKEEEAGLVPHLLPHPTPLHTCSPEELVPLKTTERGEAGRPGRAAILAAIESEVSPLTSIQKTWEGGVMKRWGGVWRGRG